MALDAHQRARELREQAEAELQGDGLHLPPKRPCATVTSTPCWCRKRDGAHGMSRGRAKVKTTMGATAPRRGHVVVTVRVGAWECRGTYRLDQLQVVLADVERAVPNWRLTERRSDPTAHALLRRFLLTLPTQRPEPKLLTAAVKAATWVAVNYPTGKFKAALADAMRDHGQAHLTLQADAAGRTWGVAVSAQGLNLTASLVAAEGKLHEPAPAVRH